MENLTAYLPEDTIPKLGNILQIKFFSQKYIYISHLSASTHHLTIQKLKKGCYSSLLTSLFNRQQMILPGLSLRLFGLRSCFLWQFEEEITLAE